VERAYERQIKMYIEVFVTSLIVDEGRCRGVVAYDMIRGGFERSRPGGHRHRRRGTHLQQHDQRPISTGSGGSGLPRRRTLKDMEFVQFPTGFTRPTSS
jgi:succinate dehydrogenase / fumarate reductase flavoprotein subunit